MKTDIFETAKKQVAHWQKEKTPKEWAEKLAAELTLNQQTEMIIHLKKLSNANGK